jgi:nucleoside phosphorylase
VRVNEPNDRWVRAVIGAALTLCLCACGGTVMPDSPPPLVAVLSAFPAEMAPILDQVAVEDTVMINAHRFRRGTIGGVRVVIGLTGIGLVNATNTARALFDQIEVNGVVFSGVAGSSLRIADVAVPLAWSLKDGTTYATNQEFLALAGHIAAAGAVSLNHCTVVPASGQPVCLPFEPAIVVGGVGLSSDPYGSQSVHCRAKGDDVFGCDVPSPDSAPVRRSAREIRGTAAADEPVRPIVEDMETAAVAREAAARGLPFIGFRAVSDGAGDPLGLPGFPVQFFAYYRLAAQNAAAATIAFLERLAASTL